ncbi:MAG: hypothetical protein ABSE48_15315, partial [Verrucomicrobiota bacterium]
MITKNRNFGLMTGILLGLAGIISAHAQSTFVTFSVDMGTNIANGTFTPGTDTVSVHGTFNGWGAGTNLVQEGSSTVYTNTLDDTSDANAGLLQYKFVIDGSTYESLATGQNRCALLPATSGASLVLSTPFFADDGAPVTNEVTFRVDVSQQIALGVFTNGTSSVEVRGLLNGWAGGVDEMTNDTSILVTNQYGLVTSNVWIGTFPVASSPAGVEAFKYVIQPGTVWDSPSPANQNGPGGGNRYFDNVAQTLPLVNFSDEPFAPLCTVTFSVDMSAQLYYGNWAPSDGVFCQGINGDWSNDTANTMTNNPSSANTNIYYVTHTLGQGAKSEYKFTYSGTSGTIYESLTSTDPSVDPNNNDNRVYVTPLASSANVPTVYFSDLSINDQLTTNVWVTFSIDMAGASQYPSGPAFDPSVDFVSVNSPAFTGAWQSWDPLTLAAYELVEVGTSSVYTNSFLIPSGSALGTTYKYGIDGADNEAASGDNLLRFIRSTATGAYSFPVDTFGNQYNEPSFGELSVGPESAGKV